MAMLEINSVELSGLLDGLSDAVDFNKDLPLNVFVGDGFAYWFFERPLLCFFDVVCGLVAESFSSFKSDVFVKFSGGEPVVGSCFSFTGSGVEEDVVWISKNFESFFCGKVSYPMVLFNGAYEWFAFESAYEELGVIAVRISALQSGFCEYLQSNFVSLDELSESAQGTSSESLIAKAFVSSYSN